MRARITVITALLTAAAAIAAFGAGPVNASPPGDERDAADYWTEQRRAEAIPRDLVVDQRGLGYLRLPDGSLRPYGHDVPPRNEGPRAETTDTSPPEPRKPPPHAGGGSNGDTTGPEISDLDPSGTRIGSAYTFSATVTDDLSGVKSVEFELTSPEESVYSYSANQTGDTWSISFSGFWDGDWSWVVIAKDGAKRGGNTSTSERATFTVDTSGGDSGGGSDGGGSGDGTTVSNAEWTNGGPVQSAAGRIYFEMPNRGGKKWDGYVCSGTAVTDSATDRSVILTAAHCVYDDANKVFARNVLFIPDQASTTGTGTDLNCENDEYGCWSPSFGVVDTQWAERVFPDNIPWDYAYYVVDDKGAHSSETGEHPLDGTVGTMDVSFDPPTVDTFTHALGYSYSEDPKFMYCAEGLAVEDSYDDYWLASCDLSGGSSGGPWTQSTQDDLGTGPLISVNSWGYSNSSGMGGPPLHGNSADCLFELTARPGIDSFDAVADGDAGIVGVESGTSCEIAS